MPDEYTGTIIQVSPVGWVVWTHRIDPYNPWSSGRDDDQLPWYAYPAPGIWEVYTEDVPPMFYDEYFQVEIDPAYRTYITIVPEIDKWSFYDD